MRITIETEPGIFRRWLRRLGPQSRRATRAMLVAAAVIVATFVAIPVVRMLVG